MRLLMVGTGKMAQEITTLAESQGHTIVGRIGVSENAGGRAITAERLQGVDMVIEFTAPDAAAANLLALAALNARVVCGTTGWEKGRPEVEAAFLAGNGALLTASNFSLGVQLMRRAIAAAAAAAAEMPGFDAFIHERHHAAKVDLPSGTAITLQGTARERDTTRAYPITAVRAGSIPGEHEVVFDAPFESVTIRHVARDRRVFAAGALTAAEWLQGRHGVYTIDALFPQR